MPQQDCAKSPGSPPVTPRRYPPCCKRDRLSPTVLRSGDGDFTQSHKPPVVVTPLTVMLLSPAFSYRANTSAPSAGAISRRDCQRGLPREVEQARLTGVTDTNLLVYKGIRSAVHPNAFHITQQGVAPSPHGRASFSPRKFSLSLWRQPHRSPGMLLAPGFGLGPASPRCPAAGARSWAQPEQPEPPARLPSGTCSRRVTAALALRGSRCATQPPFALPPSPPWVGNRSCCPADGGKGPDSLSHQHICGSYPRQLGFHNALQLIFL